MSLTPTNFCYNYGEETPVPNEYKISASNRSKTYTKNEKLIYILNEPKKKIKYTNNKILKRRNLKQLPIILV